VGRGCQDSSSDPTVAQNGNAPPTVRDRPCIDCLEEAPVHKTEVRERQTAFWLLAFLFAAVMLGTTLLSPLYVVYQAEWHFSSGIVTLVFAVYTAGVLVALLLAGRSSDQVGRRPVLAAALSFSALSSVVCTRLAELVPWLGDRDGHLAFGHPAAETRVATGHERRRGRQGRRDLPRNDIDHLPWVVVPVAGGWFATRVIRALRVRTAMTAQPAAMTSQKLMRR
jgi:hypothetical protein